MEHAAFLENDHTLLRPIDKQDSTDFIGLVSNPPYGQYSPFGAMTPESAKILFNALLFNRDDKNYHLWCVVDKTHNRFSGFIGYHPVTFENAMQDMFFWGFFSKYWGSVLPTQAAQLTYQDAFKAKALPKLIAFVHPMDVASLKGFEVLGAQFEKQTLFFGATVFLYTIPKTV